MLYKTKVLVDMTICPGTGYQQSSEEWKVGFVVADSAEEAKLKAQNYYLSQNAVDKIIRISKTEAEIATETSRGFFTDFCINEKTEV